MVKLRPVQRQPQSCRNAVLCPIARSTRFFCMVIVGFSGLAVVGFLTRSPLFFGSSVVSRSSSSAYPVVRVRKRHNMSISATTSSTSNFDDNDNTVTPQNLPHIFCYGDSLTAGTSGPFEFPYAVHLQGELQSSMAKVDWLGLPGWTAASMWQERQDPTVGLEAALTKQQRQQKPYSLVILLAGTNDMGYGYQANEIVDHLIKLHELCIALGVPRTLAIGIPPSAYQNAVDQAAALATNINQQLGQYSQEHKGQTTFIDFPFGYEQNGANWNADGLHFSQQGYQLLGESLAPTVTHILQDLSSDQGGRKLEQGKP